MAVKKSRHVEHQAREIQLFSYDIVNAPLQEIRRHWPAAIRADIDQLREQIESAPRVALPRLEELIARYPKVEILYNFRVAALQMLDRSAEAEAAAEAIYLRFPDYLFARIDWAQICLAKSEHEKVRQIFKDTWDLKLMYPHRTRFHTSEFMGFSCVAGSYFAMTGDTAAARRYLAMMQQIDPDHAATKRVEGLLNHSWIFSGIQRLLGLPRRQRRAKPVATSRETPRPPQRR